MKIIFLLLLVVSSVTAQTYVNVQQTTIVSSNNSELLNATYALNAWRNSWEKQKQRDAAISKAQSQISIVRSQYNDIDTYPDSITDGWHLVMVTDNYNYCSPAKVFIENNRVLRFVANDYYGLEMDFEEFGTIKKAKCRLSLKINPATTDIVEVYFNNDLNEPIIVAPPLNAGYISFWSDWKKSESIKLWIDDIYYGELGEAFETTPECGDLKARTFSLKPGKYSYKAAGRGTISWEGTFIINEDKCLSFVLNKSNAKQ